jgi:hypothetical protein
VTAHPAEVPDARLEERSKKRLEENKAKRVS